MMTDVAFLSRTLLFRGISAQEIQGMLGCLDAREKHYKKGEVIYAPGDLVKAPGMVLSGSVFIENDDFWGNKSILDRIQPGLLFAETYACLPGEALMVRVVAAEETEVLFLDLEHLLHVCSRTCTWHTRLISNLLMIAANKNLNLSRRIFHTSAKSIRGRLLSYLSYQAIRNGSSDFTIPFRRQELADYLGVDRSALSSELGKMQREGLLQSDKCHFVLKGDIMSPAGV